MGCVRSDGVIDLSRSSRGDGEEWIDLGCVLELESSTGKLRSGASTDSPPALPAHWGLSDTCTLWESHVGGWIGEWVPRTGDPDLCLVTCES